VRRVTRKNYLDFDVDLDHISLGWGCSFHMAEVCAVWADWVQCSAALALLIFVVWRMWFYFLKICWLCLQIILYILQRRYI